MTAADEAPEPGEWLEAPFEQADAQRVICRFDVSAVFDDEIDDEPDDVVDDLDEDLEPLDADR